jgi:hypothetical protein
MLKINHLRKKVRQKKIGRENLKARITHKPLLEWVVLLGLMMTFDKQFLGLILQ